jgi:hypothetical protein
MEMKPTLDQPDFMNVFSFIEVAGEMSPKARFSVEVAGVGPNE